MTLRILFTLAILAGLAAAPGAEQTFHWEAGGREDSVRLSQQIDRVVERVTRTAERVAERVTRRLERAGDRAAWSSARQAERTDARVRNRLRAHAVRDQGSITDNPCADGSRWDDDRYRHCEVREERLPAGPLAVDAGPNGGIRVDGWDGGDILVLAVVQTHGSDETAARRLAGGVEVRAGGGQVSATGPATDGREGWSVSYRISVPRQTDLNLTARNGGIAIVEVAGTIQFNTTNGGVRLSNLAGEVNGRTTNGGVKVSLGGTRWEGQGLDVETSNGGVTLEIPATYNAQLETRTVNGGFRFDYPLTLTGELSPRRGVSTTLGSGGPPVRARTTNGGVRLQQR